MTVIPPAILLAHQRIAEHIRQTPVLEIASGAFGLAQPMSLKLELLQHGGSFKARGAFNNLLSREVPKAGVVAASGGNHGIAVAFAARRLGITAKIFVPAVASDVKIARIQNLGAQVTVEGDRYVDALALADAEARKSGAISIHAYDSPETIAGQGSLAREWETQSPDLDTLLVAVGGGGLISGIAAWFAGRVKIVAVEPETCCCLNAAVKAGEPVAAPAEGIAADSLGAASIGNLPFEIIQQHVADSVVVPDAAIEAAQARLWRETRIAAEPGGATALSALIAGAYRPAPGERIGILVCGGNVDLAALNELAGRVA